MSCSINTESVIDWEIKHDHINKLYKHLYDKKENAGQFHLDSATKSSHSSVTTMAGEKDSVSAPDAIISWHSHPLSCYRQEKTVYGWPSGEDMRETIIYGMRGSCCHVIPSVEGTYVTQPNPCIVMSLINIENLVDIRQYPKIQKVKNWGDFLRGFIILAIEIYFRSTHVFRTMDFFKNGKTGITAKDFVKFTNNSKLSNLFSSKNSDSCGNLKCNKVGTYEGKKFLQTSFHTYVKNYEKDASIFYISKKGTNTHSGINFLKVLESGGLHILETVNLGKLCNFGKAEWKTGKMFKLTLYPNKVKYNGSFVEYESIKDKIDFITQEHKDGDIYLDDKYKVTFKLFDMSGDCSYNNLQSHVMKFSQASHFGSVKKSNRPRRSNKHIRSKGPKASKGSNKHIRSNRPRRSNRPKASKGSNGPKKQHTLHIIGSDQCPHCHTANEKAKEMMKTYKFKYTFNSYPTIQEAIAKAQLKTKRKITYVPVHFLNGKVVKDPYSLMK